MSVHRRIHSSVQTRHDQVRRRAVQPITLGSRTGHMIRDDVLIVSELDTALANS